VLDKISAWKPTAFLLRYFAANCAKEWVEPDSQEHGIWAQIGLNCCGDASQDAIFFIC